MSISYKKVFIISFIIGFIIPLISRGQVIITEIMYDPEGSDSKREWIEVLNSGTGDIDLNTWFFHENNVFHKLVAQGSSILAAGQYAIIVDSIAEVLADYPSYNGLIFDSAFSLNNTGETISTANPQKELVNTFTYSSEMGANSNGHSLQINGDKVITATSTFGTINKTESETIVEEDKDSGSTSSTSNSSSTSSSTHSQQTTVSTYTPTAPFKIGAGRERTVTVNTPIDFEAFVSKNDAKASFVWNFGNLNTRKGKNVSNIYEHPGTYQVVLEGKEGEYTAVARTQVNVILPILSITFTESSIVINNQDKSEINIGGFELVFTEGVIRVPRNTIIAGGDNLAVSRNLDNHLTSIKYPNGKLFKEFDPIIELSILLQKLCENNIQIQNCSVDPILIPFDVI